MKRIILCSTAALLLAVSNVSAQLPKRPEAQQPKANNVPQQLHHCKARNTANKLYLSGFVKTLAEAKERALLLCKQDSSPADHCNVFTCDGKHLYKNF